MCLVNLCILLTLPTWMQCIVYSKYIKRSVEKGVLYGSHYYLIVIGYPDADYFFLFCFFIVSWWTSRYWRQLSYMEDRETGSSSSVARSSSEVEHPVMAEMTCVLMWLT